MGNLLDKVIIEERVKNMVGAPYGSVKENLEWSLKAQDTLTRQAVLKELAQPEKVSEDGHHLIQVSVTRQEMLAMPKEVRYQILKRQSFEFNISYPEYYKTDNELDEQALKDKGMME